MCNSPRSRRIRRGAMTRNAVELSDSLRNAFTNQVAGTAQSLRHSRRRRLQCRRGPAKALSLAIDLQDRVPQVPTETINAMLDKSLHPVFPWLFTRQGNFEHRINLIHT